jgi:hypothetical protein
VQFELITNTTLQKVPLQLLYVIGITNQEEKKRHEVGRLDRVLLIKITIQPLTKSSSI